MRTVYALTTGSYSDYRVLAVFEAETGALAVAEEMRTDEDSLHTDVTVEPMKFYPRGERPQKVESYFRSIVVGNDGTTSEEVDRTYTEWEHDTLYFLPENGRPHVRYVRAPVYRGKAGRLEVRGTDRSAVDKAYSDNLVRLRTDADWRMRTHEGISA